MLTDTFVIRYEDKPIFRKYGVREKRILHQCFTIMEDIHSVEKQKEKVRDASNEFWKRIHKKLSNELGVRWLSDPFYQVTVGIGEYRRTEGRTLSHIEICRKFMLETPSDGLDPDFHLKCRLSLVEIFFQELFQSYQSAKASSEELSKDFFMFKIHSGTVQRNELAAKEMNLRLDQARLPLHYHNGFFQVTSDELQTSEIEQPFWSLVSSKKWENVDVDMKEAIDQRDGGGKDPAFYAARALESTIKIVSDEMLLTHGGEKGAHGFVDNLAKKSVRFLVDWEPELLKEYFTKVRNPLGHGPGKDPMPTLDDLQTNWSIEASMSWIKLLVERHEANSTGSTP